MPRGEIAHAGEWWDKVDFSILERVVSFVHPDIPRIRVTIEVWWHRDRSKSPYRFELSHYVQTPEQVRPYVPSEPYAPTEVKAVERAIAAIMDQVERAKRAGLAPDPSWLLRRPPRL